MGKVFEDDEGETTMTKEYEITFAYLTRILKDYAEAEHCYDKYGDEYTPSAGNYDNAFDEGSEYGQIHLARTLLQRIGVEFEYPCMKEDT